MRLTLSISILILLSWLPAFGQDCQCEQSFSPSEAYVNAYAVFTGKVLRSETNWMSGGMKYTFEVERGWKQDMNPVVFVSSGWEKDCGILFKEGETYLVYAQKKFTALKTDRCQGSKILSEASEDMAMLGEGTPPKATPGNMVSQMMWTLTGLTLAGMLFLAFVVLRKRFR